MPVNDEMITEQDNENASSRVDCHQAQHAQHAQHAQIASAPVQRTAEVQSSLKPAPDPTVNDSTPRDAKVLDCAPTYLPSHHNGIDERPTIAERDEDPESQLHNDGPILEAHELVSAGARG
jgi:hypothetical protein